MTTSGGLGRPSPTTPAYTAHSLTAALPVALLRKHTHAAGLLAAPMVLAATAHTPATISAPLREHINPLLLLPPTQKCTTTVYSACSQMARPIKTALVIHSYRHPKIRPITVITQSGNGAFIATTPPQPDDSAQTLPIQNPLRLQLSSPSST